MGVPGLALPKAPIENHDFRASNGPAPEKIGQVTGTKKG